MDSHLDDDLVTTAGSSSSNCSPVAEINNIGPEAVSNIGGLSLVPNSDIDGCDHFKLESDCSIEKATERIFRVGNIHVLSELKKMAHLFGMKWNFITVRSGRKI